MRGLHVASVVLLLGLGAACATSTPVNDTSGVGGASGPSSGSFFAGTTGTGVRGCGVDSTDAACLACINARCCNEGQACAADGACLSCLGDQEPPASCESNLPLSTFTLCLQSNCADRCFNGGAGGAGAGGAATSSSSSSSTAASSTAASSSSSTSSSSVASSTAASSTAASSSSSTSSSSTSSTSSSSSGGTTLTCTGVDGNAGCCDADGVLHYCEDGQTVVDQTCAGGTVCGWTDVFGYYDCVAPPSGADPSGTYPMACGG